MTKVFVLGDNGDKHEVVGLTCDLSYPSPCPLCVGGKIRVEVAGKEVLFEVVGVRFDRDDNGNDVWTAIVQPVKKIHV